MTVDGRIPAYKIAIDAKKRSCIITIEAEAESPEIAAKAANVTMRVFQDEQERLMGVKFAQMIQAAEPPAAHRFPLWRKILPLFMFIGTFLGAALAFGLDYMDFTIKNPDDVETQNILMLGYLSKQR